MRKKERELRKSSDDVRKLNHDVFNQLLDEIVREPILEIREEMKLEYFNRLLDSYQHFEVCDSSFNYVTGMNRGIRKGCAATILGIIFGDVAYHFYDIYKKRKERKKV